MWLDPALAPFSRWTDAVLLAARLIMGVVMLHYGWPKIRDPRKNAKDFDATGFRPGWLFGTLVLAAEFFGGILVLLGLYVWVAAAAFGFEMIAGHRREGHEMAQALHRLLVRSPAARALPVAPGPGAGRLSRLTSSLGGTRP